MVTNSPRERDLDQRPLPDDQHRPEHRASDGHEGRSGHDILHDAAEQTAQAVNDALSDAARLGAERLTHAAQEAVEDLDLGELSRRGRRYARHNPLQIVALGVATAVVVGLLVQAGRSA